MVSKALFFHQFLLCFHSFLLIYLFFLFRSCTFVLGNTFPIILILHLKHITQNLVFAFDIDVAIPISIFSYIIKNNN